MVTKVGMQSDFSDAIIDLLELEYDAVEAYSYAISCLENTRYKEKMDYFYQDHKRHIEELSELLVVHDVDFTSGTTAKQWILKGKVALSNMLGDEKILQAMHSNEEDTNSAYERINSRRDIWDDAENIISRGLADERKHKDWLAKI